MTSNMTDEVKSMVEQIDELSENLPRRGFLKIAIGLLNGVLALALAVPGVAYLLTPVFQKGSSTWIKVGRPADFIKTEPQKATFKYISESGYSRKEKNGFVWVVADPDSPDGLTAFSAVCSHTGCNVAWRAAAALFVCPCHGGRYSKKGEVVAGPPPRPLTKLGLKIENGQVSVRIQS